jgi:outer membrane protein OmpA-like peptidoglycan-associated protein
MLHPERVVIRPQSPSTLDKENSMLQMTRIAVLLPAVLMVVSGCATRDWVRDLMGKKEAEIGGRMDGLGNQIKTTEANLGETTKLALGAGERADGAGAKADGAVAKADGAVAKADGAVAKADGVDSRLTRIWSNRYSQKAVDTVEIYFGFGQAELSDGAQTALITVVKELEANPTLVVKLGGFTDPKGTKSYNYTLAQHRVEAVRRFLADKGVQLARVQAIGMGPLDDRGTPDEKKRRVTVTLMVDSD